MTADTLDPAARFTVNAITNPLNIDRVEKAFAEELNEFLANGPTSAELLDAKKAYLEAQKVRAPAMPPLPGKSPRICVWDGRSPTRAKWKSGSRR